MNEIVEMIVEPTPQWIKEAGKEIAQKYNLLNIFLWEV